MAVDIPELIPIADNVTLSQGSTGTLGIVADTGDSAVEIWVKARNYSGAATFVLTVNKGPYSDFSDGNNYVADATTISITSNGMSGIALASPLGRYVQITWTTTGGSAGDSVDVDAFVVRR